MKQKSISAGRNNNVRSILLKFAEFLSGIVYWISLLLGLQWWNQIIYKIFERLEIPRLRRIRMYV